jgi:hypothetical protein
MKFVIGALKALFQQFVVGPKGQKMRKGLYIGINDYDYINKLSGCNNDAMAMASVLERHGTGSPNFSNIVLTTAETSISRAKMKTEIQSLFEGNCDVALLYFAGHGSFDQSVNEGVLIPQDHDQGDEGIRVSDILGWAEAATGIKNKIIILDCCQAGAAGASRELKGGASIIGDGITILTACKKEETAKEREGHGVFTGLLLQALHGAASNVLGDITPGSMYSFVDNALGPWDQRPVFKTNVSQFVALREMPPLVSKDILRKLPIWFPEPESIFNLDPSYEPEAKEHFIPEHGEIFAQLQRCNRHSLVEPIDEDHMYFAAMNSTGCRLTAFGAYYRKLAKKGHL